jgi:hypothetical protein
MQINGRSPMSDQDMLWVMAAIAALAWVRFAEHPTARNLRTAIADTLGL